MYTDSSQFACFEDLYNSVDMGLDIVFFLFGERYNISWRDYKPFICTCPDGEAVVFEDAKDLLDNYKVRGKPLKDLWQEIDIDYM